jgi:outer membrane immunogenic protein
MTLSKFLRAGAAALGALAVASVSQANAADMYAGGMKDAPAYIPPPMWTGFYLGGHIGAAWENSSFNRHQFDDHCWNTMWWKDYGVNTDHCGDSSHPHSAADLNPDHRSDGDAFGGVQFGYNFQSPGAFVYGIEVDLGGMALNGRGHAQGNTSWVDKHGNTWATPVTFDGDSQGGFYGDVTGRLGWTWGPALLYAKGGFAWLNADLRMKESVTDTWGKIGCGTAWCDSSNDHNTTLTGWTVGGGVEWKVSPLWSIKAEYLHFEFDNFNNNCCNDWISQQNWGVNNNFDNHAKLQIDTVKLGFNYFLMPVQAPIPLK